MIVAPIRAVFGLYLLKFLQTQDVDKKFLKGTAYLIVIVGVGSAIIGLNPEDISRTLHLIGSAIYFFGVVIIQISISKQELKIVSIPRFLPITGLSVVACNAIFIVFEISELLANIFRLLACFFEWMALFCLLVWFLVQWDLHSKNEISIIQPNFSFQVICPDAPEKLRSSLTSRVNLCQNCGGILRPFATVCDFCGHNVGQILEAPDQPTSPIFERGGDCKSLSINDEVTRQECR